MTASIESSSTGSRRAAIRRGMGPAHLRPSGPATLVALCGVWCATAAAAQEVEPVHLVYETSGQCPSEDAFVDMVARDGGRFARAPDRQAGRTFRVEIGGTGPVTGRLVVRDADGSEAVRELAGARCDDVVRSLAVLVALSVEPVVPAAPAAPVPAPEVPRRDTPVPGLARVPGDAAADQAVEPSPESSDLRDVSAEFRPQACSVNASSDQGRASIARNVHASTRPTILRYVVNAGVSFAAISTPRRIDGARKLGASSRSST